MTYRIVVGMSPPVASRPLTRNSLDGLIELAKKMDRGDAAILSQSEVQTFRIILIALGFRCITDGYRCDVVGKTLAFKLSKDESNAQNEGRCVEFHCGL